MLMSSKRFYRLVIECLEDRTNPAPLYVITHGFQFNSSDVPDWALDMATAINRKDGLGYSAAQIQNSIVRYDATNLNPAGGAASFLIFNWADVSGITSPGTADDDNVAGVLAEAVRERFAASGSLDIHFIGHSRGTYVNLSAIQRLNNATDNAHIGRLQMTTLDPEFYSSGSNPENLPRVVPSNVDWADNYYQRVDSSLSVPGVVTAEDPWFGGGMYTGAINVDLSTALGAWEGRSGSLPTHTEAHDWYHWTIDSDDRDVSTVRYRDADLNAQQDTFLSNPAQGRALLFSQEVDLNNDGTPDDLTLGSNIGFLHSVGQAFGPSSFAGFKGLDLVFVIDTTGSMSDDIESVKAAANEIINTIRTTVPNSQISVITYRDYPDGTHGDFDDYQARVESGLTSNFSQISSAINGIVVGGGADWPESVYAGVNMAISGTAWRGGENRKAVILMGDAPGHDPEPGTGNTLVSTILQAYYADPVDLYTVNIGFDSDSARTFESMAQLSRGKFFQANSATDVVPALLEAIQDITTGVEGGASSILAFGADQGNAPRIGVIDPVNGTQATSFLAFDGKYKGGVKVATGDLDGDGVADILAVQGSGSKPALRAYQQDGTVIPSPFNSLKPFTRTTKSLEVALADFNGDGIADLVVAGVEKGSSIVKVYDGSTGARLWQRNFGGVRYLRVATGDLDGDGVKDLATLGIANHRTVMNAYQGGTFSSLHVTSPLNIIDAKTLKFMTREASGLSLSLADVDNDGIADIAASLSVDEGWTRIIVATSSSGTVQKEISHPRSDRGNNYFEVRLAWVDLDQDGALDLAGMSNGSRKESPKLLVYSSALADVIFSKTYTGLKHGAFLAS